MSDSNLFLTWEWTDKAELLAAAGRGTGPGGCPGKPGVAAAPARDRRDGAGACRLALGLE